MIPTSLRELALLTGGSLHPDTPDTARVVVDGPVVTDSREAGPGSLYVARVGEHADGHRFAGAAGRAGAVAALTSRPLEDLPCLVVDDVQTSFGTIARGVLDRLPGVRVVAVTGSSGKTSTKDLLAQVLAAAGETVAPVDSLNGEIGVPLTVCRVTGATRFLVVEMGARGIGHLTYLASIAPPDVAVVLNVGTAHVGEFGSRENIALAKGELVEALSPEGLAVLNADDPAVAAMAGRTRARVVTVGVREPADVTATGVSLDAGGRATFTLNAIGTSRPVRLQVAGAHQVGNALAVAAAALECGMSLDVVAQALGDAAPASRWRMEVTERGDGVTVVNDAYNANPDSMAAALRAVRTIADAVEPPRRTWAVLGEMLELGELSRAEHETVGRLAVELGIDRVLAVGAGARAVADAAARGAAASGATAGGATAGGAAAGGATAGGATADSAATWVPDTDAAYALLAEGLTRGDVVLLKSSRDSGLRWLGDRLVGLEVPS